MRDIAFRAGFIPESTWLLIHRKENGNILSCGTIQGIQAEPYVAAIQNIGIIPGYRGRGLGSIMVRRSLQGLQELGMQTATLEVTAHNSGAIRLYQRLGFVVAKVVYRSVEIMSR
jgi:ribosomal protein S18 acetylase RimI-like enzyme